MSDCLPQVRSGEGPARTILLHGFGGMAAQWSLVQQAMTTASVAFDLPGHGGAVPWEGGYSPIEARNAVIAEMDALGNEQLALCGHSRGGAIACLVAMKVPERVSALTLVAPGGFGPEIDGQALARYAAANDVDAMLAAMQELAKPDSVSRDLASEMVAVREANRSRDILQDMAASMLVVGKQGALDFARLRDSTFPITIIWGTDDAVLPFSQADALGERARLVKIGGAGHMLTRSHPDEIARHLDAALSMS